MKPRIIVIGILVCIICLFLWWNRPQAEREPTIKNTVTAITNVPLIARPREQKPKSDQGTNRSLTVALAKDPRTMDPQDFQKWMVTEWQRPINFYGKVVDERSNAVARAQVRFNWDQLPLGHDPRHFTTESDSTGLFSLTEAKGSGLDVWVSKQGYYTPRSGGAISSTSGASDPLNPVIFQLRKKGQAEPLLRLAGAMGGTRQYRLDTKGTPTDISFYTGQRASPEKSQFRVEFWMKPPEHPSQRQFQWLCRVTVPGGGLQAAPDEFPFLAPENGYQASDEIKSEENPQAWSDRIQRSYYVQLQDGKYGLVKLNVVCSGNPFLGVEVLVNPSGSRNLEYDKYLPGNILVNQSSP